jgi:hypothetical protein
VQPEVPRWTTRRTVITYRLFRYCVYWIKTDRDTLCGLEYGFFFCSWWSYVLNITYLQNVLDICNYVPCWRSLRHAPVNTLPCITYCEQHCDCWFREVMADRNVLYFGMVIILVCILACKSSDVCYMVYKGMQFIIFTENFSSIFWFKISVSVSGLSPFYILMPFNLFHALYRLTVRYYIYLLQLGYHPVAVGLRLVQSRTEGRQKEKQYAKLHKEHVNTQNGIKCYGTKKHKRILKKHNSSI